MGKRDPLAPGNVDVRLTFGDPGTPTTTLPAFDALKGFGGQPLFCHAQSDQTTLSLLIDDIPGGDVQSSKKPLPEASRVTVTFMLAGKLVHAWDPVPLQYKGLQPLNFSATVSPSLGTLHFSINDALVGDGAADPGHRNGFVSFVLVEQADSEFQIVWIQSRTAVIRNADELTDASVVLPNDSATAASITGPMGFTLP